MDGIGTLVLISLVMFFVLGAITVLAHIYNLNSIKAKTVGDGQHGTARWARTEEIQKVYKHIPFEPERWRRGENLPNALRRKPLGCGVCRHEPGSACSYYQDIVFHDVDKLLTNIRILFCAYNY